MKIMIALKAESGLDWNGREIHVVCRRQASGKHGGRRERRMRSRFDLLAAAVCSSTVMKVWYINTWSREDPTLVWLSNLGVVPRRNYIAVQRLDLSSIAFVC